jgi:predicted secreted protein
MTWVSMLAVFFIVWWLVLFAILPFGLKTQDDDGEVTLGTVSSAPGGAHMRRAIVWTTLVALLICGSFFVVTRYFDLSVDDIPHIVPEFR